MATIRIDTRNATKLVSMLHTLEALAARGALGDADHDGDEESLVESFFAYEVREMINLVAGEAGVPAPPNL